MLPDLKDICLPVSLELARVMTRRIKGIFFDLGDTLLEFGKVDIRSAFEAGAGLAHEYLTGLGHKLPPLAKYHRQQLWAIRWNYFKSKFTQREFNSLDLLGRLSARMGHNLTPQQTAELAWLWYKPLSECATIEDGLTETLSTLKQAGLTLGIISNTFVPGEVLDRHLEREGLLEFLPIRIYSCDVRYRKPNPAVFRIALERTGLAAGETMFVGDSPHADIRGADLAGMISVLKDPTGRYNTTMAGATYRIARIAELPPIVADQGALAGRSQQLDP